MRIRKINRRRVFEPDGGAATPWRRAESPETIRARPARQRLPAPRTGMRSWPRLTRRNITSRVFSHLAASFFSSRSTHRRDSSVSGEGPCWNLSIRSQARGTRKVPRAKLPARHPSGGLRRLILGRRYSSRYLRRRSASSGHGRPAPSRRFAAEGRKAARHRGKNKALCKVRPRSQA